MAFVMRNRALFLGGAFVVFFTFLYLTSNSSSSTQLAVATETEIDKTSVKVFAETTSKPSRVSVFEGATNPSVRQCTQEERLQNIKHYCNISRQATLPHLMFPNGRSLFDEEKKFLLCWMSKAGSTALKATILDTKGFNRYSQNNRSNLNPAHSSETLRKYGLKYLKMVDEDKRREIANNYFNMLSIRHPFDRLVSYYRDKIVDDDIGSAHPKRAAEILRYTRGELFAQNSTLAEMEYPQTVLGSPTFEEFIKWMYEKRIIDEHWNFIIHACHPCAHHWNAILRMETIAVDGKILLKKIGSKRDNILIRHTHRNDIEMNYFEKHLPEYRLIPSQVIDYLMKIYSTDMAMFGYGWDKQRNTAYCRIETASGFCC